MWRGNEGSGWAAGGLRAGCRSAVSRLSLGCRFWVVWAVGGLRVGAGQAVGGLWGGAAWKRFNQVSNSKGLIISSWAGMTSFPAEGCLTSRSRG